MSIPKKKKKSTAPNLPTADKNSEAAPQIKTPEEEQEFRRRVETKFVELKKQINSTLIFSTYFFFNLMLHRFIWKVDFSCPPGVGGYIRFRNPEATDIENGTIWVSADLVNQPDFESRHLLFVLVHELLHVIFLHNARCSGRIHKLWNIATDQVINNLIRRTFPKTQDIDPFGGYGKSGGCICYDKIDGQSVSDPRMSAEDVYEVMKKYFRRWEVTKLFYSDGTTEELGGDGQQPNGSDGDSGGSNSNNTSLGGNSHKKVSAYEVTDLDTGEKFVVGNNEADSDTQRAVDQFSRLAGEIYSNFKGRGCGSGSIFEVFEEFFRTDLPWDKILENIIRKNVTLSPNSRGWQTLNKKFLGLGFTLPGTTYDEDVKVDVGVVSIDTSGSISSEELGMFADVLVESLDYFERIVLITHDSEIKQHEEFFSYDKDRLRNYIQSVGFRGRGGTSHADVFRRIQEIHDRSSVGVSIYIGLTDGWSDVDAEWETNAWSRKNEIPSCFVLTQNHSKPKICGAEGRGVSHVVIDRRSRRT